jgi:hypothetical protein
MRNVITGIVLFAALSGFAGFVFGDEAKPEEKRSLLRSPSFEQPKPGRTLDVSFKVVTEGIPEGAQCISVMQEQATILIHRDILEYLKIAKPVEEKTDDDHMATIHGRRAEILLHNLMSIKDDHGCSLVEMPFDDDALYLIGELLKSGQVMVIDNVTNRPVEYIYVRYKAFVAGPLAGKGDIIFSFAEKASPFVMVRWWIS